MKPLKLTLFLFCVINFALAQNETDYWAVDTESNFVSAHSPYTDAISMWILRQNLTINAYQAFIGSELMFNNADLEKTNNTVELYLPIFNKGGLTAMFGTGFSRNFFMSQDDKLNEPVMGFSQFWIPIQYNTDQWKFTFLYERLLAGKSQSLFNEIGNAQRVFLMASHAFNRKWCLTVFGAYFEDNMESDKNSVLTPAFQLRYSPSRNVVMSAGAPLLFGIEWSVSPKWDIYFSQVMLDETNAFVTYNFTPKVGLSLHYAGIQTGASTYFPSEMISASGENYRYNNAVQLQSNIALQLGLKVFDHVGLVFSGGYKIGSELDLYNNTDKLTTIDGKSDYFVGFNIQYLKYF